MADTLSFNGQTVDLAADTTFASSNGAVKVVIQITPGDQPLFNALLESKDLTQFEYREEGKTEVQSFSGSVSRIVPNGSFCQVEIDSGWVTVSKP